MPKRTRRACVREATLQRPSRSVDSAGQTASSDYLAPAGDEQVTGSSVLRVHSHLLRQLAMNLVEEGESPQTCASMYIPWV
eukprot:6180634-Pleurochrysis_carterae.AAC.2